MASATTVHWVPSAPSRQTLTFRQGDLRLSRSPCFLLVKVMRRNDRKGTAVVEFAMVVPLFALMLVGMLEIGRNVQVHQIASNAAREGARLAATDDSNDTKVRTAVMTYLEQAGIAGWSSPEVPRPFTDAVVTIYPPNIDKLDAGTPVTVTVELDWTKVRWVPGGIVKQNPICSATMRREGT